MAVNNGGIDEQVTNITLEEIMIRMVLILGLVFICNLSSAVLAQGYGKCADSGIPSLIKDVSARRTELTYEIPAAEKTWEEYHLAWNRASYAFDVSRILLGLSVVGLPWWAYNTYHAYRGETPWAVPNKTIGERFELRDLDPKTPDYSAAVRTRMTLFPEARKDLISKSDSLVSRKGFAKFKTYIDAGLYDEYAATVRYVEFHELLHLLVQEDNLLAIVLKNIESTCN